MQNVYAMRPEVRAEFAGLRERLDGDTAFLTRLERFFTELRDPLVALYGDDPRLPEQFAAVLEAIAAAARERDPELRRLDHEREITPDWLQREQAVGYVCYADRFAGTLAGVAGQLPYPRELGVDYLHLMPLPPARPSPATTASAPTTARSPTARSRTSTSGRCRRSSRTSRRGASRGSRSSTGGCGRRSTSSSGTSTTPTPRCSARWRRCCSTSPTSASTCCASTPCRSCGSARAPTARTSRRCTSCCRRCAPWCGSPRRRSASRG